MSGVTPSPHRPCCLLLSFLAICAVGMCQDCEFVQSANTYADGSTGSSSSAATAEACKTACGAGCLAVLFESSAGTKCKTFTTEPQNVEISSSKHSGKTLYRKSCTSDCTFTKTSTVNADSGDAKFSATTPDSCKTLCGKSCFAVLFDGVSAVKCRVYTIEPPNVKVDPKLFTGDLYRRNCPGGNTGSTCTMTSEADKTVTSSQSLSLDLTVSADQCKRTCRWLTECTAVSWDSSTCILHTSTAIISSAIGYTHAGKTQCPNKTSCCFENEQQGKKGTSLTFSTAKANVDTCKEICVNVRSCEAATYSGSTCNLFTSALTISSQAGSSYFSKSCTGSLAGSLTLYSRCEISGGQQVTPLSNLVGVGFAMLLMCLP